jgi:hypothetical protein
MAPTTRMRTGSQQTEYDDRPKEGTESWEKECLIANRKKLNKAAEDFSRTSRIKTAAFQASILCGPYMFDSWESLFVLAIYVFLLSLIIVGLNRQLQLF